MGKLTFIYGVMGAAKSADLLITNFNLFEKGIKTLLFTPSIDNRNIGVRGFSVIRSRIGIESEAIVVSSDYDIYGFFKKTMVEEAKPLTKVVLVDESQFLTSAQIEQFAHVADDFNLDVRCYGLKTDFRSQLFPASKRLMELADETREIPFVCKCGQKATINARLINNKVVYDGPTILVGDTNKKDDIRYEAMCRNCWRKEQWAWNF